MTASRKAAPKRAVSNMFTLKFDPTANENVVADISKYLLLQIAADSDNNTIVISSTARSPYEQAVVMYDNSQRNMAHQYETYGIAGDKVIDVYKTMAYQKPHDRAVVIRSMMNKINELGPTNVSDHCRTDTDVINVLDVRQSSVNYKAAFIREVEKYIPTVILELRAENHCFHIEINVPVLQTIYDSNGILNR